MKWRNAYLLLYSRKMQEDVFEEDEEETKKTHLKQQQQQQQVLQTTASSSNHSVDVEMLSANTTVNEELSEIEMKIAYENQKYWQNRFLFGTEYHELIYDITLNWNTACIVPKQYQTKNDDYHIVGFPRPIEYLSDSSIPELLDISMDLSLHVPADTLKACEFEVFKLAVGFYVGILQRSMAKNWLPQTLNLIKAYINKSEQCAYWVLEEFSNEQLIEENLIQN